MKKDMINREQRLDEPGRWSSCSDYDDRSRPWIRANDQGRNAFGFKRLLRGSDQLISAFTKY
jgi:hypothetical protein